MLKTILRKEHKNQWEKRVALTPIAVSELTQNGIAIDIEHSDYRIFPDSEYISAGAGTAESPSEHELVLGIKEPPVSSIKQNQMHLCFSHTIKGQDYNMPLLQQFIDQSATLIDYELMTDKDNIRTIAFGRYAGIAGAIDSLWLYGKKITEAGRETALSKVTQSWQYKSQHNAQQQLEKIDLSDAELTRVIILGNGKVGLGAAEVCTWLGFKEITPEDIYQGRADNSSSWFSVFDVKDMYCRLADGGFDKSEYIEQGKALYRSRFTDLLGKFDVVLQSSFWTEDYPRHLDRSDLLKHKENLPELLGDISCDIEGSFACTLKATDIENPVFSYDPETEQITDGMEMGKISVMSIDNLPCELSQDASEHFSSVLAHHIPALMNIDFSESFGALQLDAELKDAFIVYKGQLTPKFEYLKEFLG